MDAHLPRQLALLQLTRVARLLILGEPLVVDFVHGLPNRRDRRRRQLRSPQLVVHVTAGDARRVWRAVVAKPLLVHFVDRLAGSRGGLRRGHPAR
jgi:hypothetical protein